jgi:TonB family protein
MAEGVEGTVLIGLIIDASGKVEPSSITFVHRVDPRLDEAAADLLRESTFWPACREGLAVRMHTIMPVGYAVRK